MKKLLIVLAVIVVIALGALFAAGYFLGTIPVVSDLLGTNKARDLGIELSVDAATRGLEHISYPTTPAALQAVYDNPDSFKTFRGALTSEEASSLLATADIDNFPLKLTQVKFGPNGNVQTSGILWTEDLQEFLRDLGISGGALDTVMDYVKNASSLNYYIDATCSVVNNRVNLDLNSFQIGRINLPDSVVQENLGSIGDMLSNQLYTRGYNIRSLTISEDRVNLDMDRPLDNILPWINSIQY